MVGMWPGRSGGSARQRGTLSDIHGGPKHHRLLGSQENVLSNIAMLFECKTHRLFRAFYFSVKVFQSGSCLEEIWKQRPFGCPAGGEGHQPVSFCLLVQLSLCLPPSSFSHSPCLSRNKDTFPAEHSCGSPSPNKYGSWVLTAAADLCWCEMATSQLSVSCTGHAEPVEWDRSRDKQRWLFHSLQNRLKTANFSRFSSLLQAFTHYDRVGAVSSLWTHLDVYRLSFRQPLSSVALWWKEKLLHPQTRSC